MTTNERIDLSQLDPECDPERLERVVRGVLERLGHQDPPEPLSLRRQIALVLARKSRPLLAAACLVALISGAVLLSRPPVEREATGDPGLALLEAWLATGTTPSTRDFLFLLAGDAR